MKILSNWRSGKLWETQLERQLHRDHSLRTHGLLIGACTLLLIRLWAYYWVERREGGLSDPGGGASGDFGDAAGHIAGEAAIVAVPVVAIFLIGIVLVSGAGALALLHR